MFGKRVGSYDGFDVVVRCGATDCGKSNEELMEVVGPYIKKPNALVGFCNKEHTKVKVIEVVSGSINRATTRNCNIKKK